MKDRENKTQNILGWLPKLIRKYVIREILETATRCFREINAKGKVEPRNAEFAEKIVSQNNHAGICGISCLRNFLQGTSRRRVFFKHIFL